MTEEEKPPGGSPEPLQSFVIDQHLVERWLQIPPLALITVPTTRQDVDHLFFAHTSMAMALERLQGCLILYSQGKLDEANKAMVESQRQNVEGDNYIRKFMAAMMAGAQVVGGKNDGT